MKLSKERADNLLKKLIFMSQRKTTIYLTISIGLI